MSTGIADSVDLNVVMENDELNRRYMTQRIIAMRDQTQKQNDAGLRQTLLYRNLSASLKNTVGQPVYQACQGLCLSPRPRGFTGISSGPDCRVYYRNVAR